LRATLGGVEVAADELEEDRPVDEILRLSSADEVGAASRMASLAGMSVRRLRIGVMS
jgi:hypothetical protein